MTLALVGTLANFLVAEISRLKRANWSFLPEGRLFDDRVAARLDFDPRVDLLLLRPDGSRVAIELEISRADPVANQVKFLLAREQGALRRDDVFVSMVSSHVVSGRRAVAAAFTRHMRSRGLAAFQASLLPFTLPQEIKALNGASAEDLRERRLPVHDEIARVFEIVEPRGDTREHRIHFAADVTDVIANLWRFNDGLERGEPGWTRRSVQYFVVDPASQQFAPAKFCAFVPASIDGEAAAPPTMTFDVYAGLGEGDPRFDGHRARTHLARRLAFETVTLSESPFVSDFARWHTDSRRALVELRAPVTLLVPPRWHWQRSAR